MIFWGVEMFWDPKRRVFLSAARVESGGEILSSPGVRLPAGISLLELDHFEDGGEITGRGENIAEVVPQARGVLRLEVVVVMSADVLDEVEDISDLVSQ